MASGYPTKTRDEPLFCEKGVRRMPAPPSCRPMCGTDRRGRQRIFVRSDRFDCAVMVQRILVRSNRFDCAVKLQRILVRSDRLDHTGH